MPKKKSIKERIITGVKHTDNTAIEARNLIILGSRQAWWARKNINRGRPELASKQLDRALRNLAHANTMVFGCIVNLNEMRRLAHEIEEAPAS